MARPFPIASALIDAVLTCPASAHTDGGRIEQLEQQIQALQKRIAALEARTTFTSFMPNFAERFHVMQRAGEAGDWAVASHELKERKRLTALSTNIDEDRVELMKSMMGPQLDALEEAIEHGDTNSFSTALDRTIKTCSGCHAAVGSDFIQVVLDAPEALSIRHPHKLKAREVVEGHTHAMPSDMDEMSAEHGHDDTGESPHEH